MNNTQFDIHHHVARAANALDIALRLLREGREGPLAHADTYAPADQIIAGILSTHGLNAAAHPGFCLPAARAIICAIHRNEVPGIAPTGTFNEVKLARKERDRALATLAKAEQDRDNYKREMLATQAERDSARGQRDVARGRVEELEAEVKKHTQERDDAHAQLAATRDILAGVVGDLSS